MLSWLFAQIMLSIAAAVVATSSVVLGKKLGLAYSAKLYAIAFLIVTFGRFALFAVCGLSVHMLA